MAKHYFCDKCGKEINDWRKHIYVNSEIYSRNDDDKSPARYKRISNRHMEKDLCKDCGFGFVKGLADFFENEEASS